jgi:RNase P subunit RPR2
VTASSLSADERLAAVLKEHSATRCKSCRRKLDRGDVSWQNASTEAGTGFTTVYIICQSCGTETAEVFSWYPETDSFEEAVRVLEEDWEGVPLR